MMMMMMMMMMMICMFLHVVFSVVVFRASLPFPGSLCAGESVVNRGSSRVSCC